MVDTDVVAAALLGEPTTGEEAARLLAGRWEMAAPSHWKAELANILWKAVRLGRLELAEVDGILTVAETLPIWSVDVAELWRGAVARGVAGQHPAYDTLFVELSVRLDCDVVSYDRALQRRYPEHVRHPRDFLADPRRKSTKG